VQLAVAHDEVDASQNLALLVRTWRFSDLELTCHYAATAFFGVVGISSASVVSWSV